jgi:hypothetical protein
VEHLPLLLIIRTVLAQNISFTTMRSTNICSSVQLSGLLSLPKIVDSLVSKNAQNVHGEITGKFQRKSREPFKIAPRTTRNY